MRAQYAAELRRIRSRRAARFTVAGAAVVVVAVGVIAGALSDRDVAGARERARVQRTEEIRACLAGENGTKPDLTGTAPEVRCEVSYTPEQAAARTDPRARLDRLEIVLLGLAGPVVLAALLLGATFLGAEYGSRSLTTTLLWEPRRTRVLVAKVAACATTTAAGAAAFLVAAGGSFAVAAALRGTTEGIGPAWLAGVAGLAGRIAIAAGVAGALGVAATAITRHTGATTGAAFFVLGPFEGALRGMRAGWSPWLVAENSAAFISGASLDGVGRSWLGGGVVLLVYAGIVLIVAAALFRRRDIG